MRIALTVTSSVFVIEIVGGWWSGSLALLADAGHMFTDVGALLLAYSAMTLADRGPSRRYTFGLHRAEILAAFVNAQILLVVGALVLYESYERWQQPVPIDARMMIVVALIGLTANLVSLRYLHGHHQHSLNLRAAYLEVLTDALASIAVVVAAVLIAWRQWLWADPLVSVLIALFILPRAWSILRQAGHVLLEGTPAHVDLAEVHEQLADLPGVEEIHDFHCWTLTSGVDSASVHVRMRPGGDPAAVRRSVERIMHSAVGVEHVTVQLEASSDECRGPTH